MGNVIILGKHHHPKPLSLERLDAAAKQAGADRMAELNAADRMGQLHGHKTALRVVLGDLEKIRAIATRALALLRPASTGPAA
jgi:hypothetical protein